MICIIDYQMGNLRSVQKGFEKAGHEAIISGDGNVVRRADKIVLPGVGAFRYAIREIHGRDLVGPILETIASDKPFLGICLGLQLLFDVSYEGGEFEGLGIVPGKVVRFDVPPEYKVPHMGWNQTRFEQSLMSEPLLAGIQDNSFFYYVHSYYVAPSDPSVTAAVADYPDPFCAMIRQGNLYATQFHPEKSQADGLRILKNFGNLVQPES